MSYKSEAQAANAAHCRKIIDAAGGGSYPTPHGDGARAKFKNGGRVGYADGGSVEGDTPMSRLDRPSRGKKGGATTVNVIVAQKPDQAPPVPMMPPPGLGAPPAPPSTPIGAGGPPVPPPGMMGRKSGGRVFAQIDDGAGSGPGRLEKIKAYGAKAGKPIKAVK